MIWILAAFIILFLLILIFGLDREYAKLSDGTIDRLSSFGDTGICSLGLSDKSCDQPDESSCSEQKDPNGLSKCIWCYGDINSAEIGSCQSRTCGCGTFRSRNAIEITDMGDLYKRGDTLVLAGRVQRAQGAAEELQKQTLTGLRVDISFLDTSRSPTVIFGPPTFVLTDGDGQGSFKFEHSLPDDAPYGRYNVMVKYADAVDVEDFDIQK